ncbi:MAG: hypothetical protein FWH39_01610 [Bacteroidales bacterium]|nr:hypothetical protein [Bacteroidales bacterium]
MYILNCKIIIETKEKDGKKVNYAFKHVNSVTVTTSMDTLTDTCQIKLPRKYAKQKDRENDLTKIFAKGNRVKVELGYGEKLNTVFEGFISKDVSYSNPALIECEDKAWLLKRKKTDLLPPKEDGKLMLSEVINKFIPQTFLDEHELKLGFVPDFCLGKYPIDAKLSIAKLLENIMGAFPLQFFFIDDVFHAVAYSEFMQPLKSEKNINFYANGEKCNVISDTLVYTKKEDSAFQVMVSGPVTVQNAPKIDGKYPSDAQDTVHKREWKTPITQQEADDIAKKIYNSMSANKMSGSFTAFGIPFVKKGNIVRFFDDDNKERDNKRFLVKAVTYSFGEKGYRQEITLGNQPFISGVESASVVKL